MGLTASYGKRQLQNKRVTRPDGSALSFRLSRSGFLQRLPFCFLYSMAGFPLVAISAQHTELSKITASFSPNTVIINRTTYAITATRNKDRSVDYSFQPYDSLSPSINFNLRVRTSASGSLYQMTSDTMDIKATASLATRPGVSAPAIRLDFNNNQTNNSIMASQTTTPASIFLNSSFVAGNSTSINITLPSDGSKQTPGSKAGPLKMALVIILTIILSVVLGLYYCCPVKEKGTTTATGLNKQAKCLRGHPPPPDDCAGGIELTLFRQLSPLEDPLTGSGTIFLPEENQSPLYRGSLTRSETICFTKESEQLTQSGRDDNLVREGSAVTVEVTVHSSPASCQQPDPETSTVD
ncbi:hypothetical protein [Endozoicomonas lisbonensis]|uniref:Uncharacterized protein n=1 Tax=Endozoicomonas lisbonensis TaxID=3120522 RepID=A0ABV2SKJ2_9GAMM